MYPTQRNRPKFVLGLIACAILLWATPGGAQQPQPATPATTPSSSQSQPASAGQQGQQQGLNTVNTDRLFGVLPNYATVETEHEFGPLTVKDKFKLTADSMFDPVTFPFIGLEAVISQAQNSDPEYGQGLKGYGARYGTAYGDALFGTTMTTSVFPSLLHQDPRYFQLGQGSIVHRSWYSVSRIFWTRNDDGSHGFNYSEIAGNLVAAGISNAYHPAQERTVSNTLSVWGTDIMWDAASNVAKEFWPDIRRKIHKQKDQD
ncbi:MAG TPA: hypothetical protein VNV41_01460 [Candidatus Acidoferrales bacterium]|jgi:hypothetical protein|nr:hypothetical protein [Candidatus Acidoferrales bacterium]